MAINIIPLKELLKWIRKKIEERLNPSLIHVEDFRDARRLAKMLQDPKDPTSRYIYDQFGLEERRKLNDYIEDSESNSSFPKYLSKKLNELLKRRDFYEKGGFNKEDLSAETRKLLEQNPTSNDDIIRLNRSSLEDVYPRFVARSYFPRRIKWTLLILFPCAINGIYDWASKGIDYAFVHSCQYEFEDTNKLPGWIVAKDHERGFALSNTGISNLYYVKGKASMSVHVELDGTEEGRGANKDEGEVYVDVRLYKPSRESNLTTSLDLSNKTLKASIVFPNDTKLGGKLGKEPNFVQLFLETCGAESERFDLTPPENITGPGKLDLKYKMDASKNNICKIGIKIGMYPGNPKQGIKPKDHNIYTGDIFIDCVDW